MVAVLGHGHSNRLEAIAIASGFQHSGEQSTDSKANIFRPHFHLAFIAFVTCWSYAGWALWFYPEFRHDHPLLTIAICPFFLYKMEGVELIPIWQFVTVSVIRGSLLDYSAFILGKYFQSWRHMTLPRIPVISPIVDRSNQVRRWLKNKRLSKLAFVLTVITVWLTSRMTMWILIILAPVAFMFNGFNILTALLRKRYPKGCEKHWLLLNWWRFNKEQMFVAGLYQKPGIHVAFGSLMGSLVIGILPYYGIGVT